MKIPVTGLPKTSQDDVKQVLLICEKNKGLGVFGTVWQFDIDKMLEDLSFCLFYGKI